MNRNRLPVERFSSLETPFYYYDIRLLRKTLETLANEAKRDGFHVHYALKANTNPVILEEIRKAGLGADCVSGGEIETALAAGIPAAGIVFAGVGKADWEIDLALEHDIFCFNVESIPELEVIDTLAGKKGVRASVALRINPNIEANTHHYITTGLNENKFGLSVGDIEKVVEMLPMLRNVKLIGIHFHIGSQITDMQSFQGLCIRINEIDSYFASRRILLKHINVGGGLGIDYEKPYDNPVPDFISYFNIFRRHLELKPYQRLHFELGRSVVGQCGYLIGRVLFVKEGVTKKFAILDAGMNDLIRPSLYQAYHFIENLSSEQEPELYDIVGPVCESADSFAKNYYLNNTQRGDLLAIHSVGAYGEVMASRYNLRKLPESYTSEELL